MKINMKCQLSKAKEIHLKQFFFGFVLVAFLEQVSLFQYQLIEVDPTLPWDPWMVRWSELMHRIMGGQQMSYKPTFFSWLLRQLIVVEDWPYNGTDFSRDPKMPLPEGEDFDDGGKNKKKMMFFYCFLKYVFMTLQFYECRCWTTMPCWDVLNFQVCHLAVWCHSLSRGKRQRGGDYTEHRGFDPWDPRVCSNGWCPMPIPEAYDAGVKLDSPTADSHNPSSYILSWASCHLVHRSDIPYISGLRATGV